MAKILSVPDIHGTHLWETVKSHSSEEYDYIVFHGDYFDAEENEWPDQGDNDSPQHEFYGIFDTRKENPFMTLQEYFKARKKTMKIINDISSQLIYHRDMEGFIRKSLNEHFPEDVAAKILRIGFKEYLNPDYISAMNNIWEMQKAAHQSGADKMTLEEINAEISRKR